MSPANAFIDLAQAMNSFTEGVVPAFERLLQAVDEAERKRAELEDELEDLKSRSERLGASLRDTLSGRPPRVRGALRLFIERRIPKDLTALPGEEFQTLLHWITHEAAQAFSAAHPDLYAMPDLRPYERWLVQTAGLLPGSAREYRRRLAVAARILNTQVENLPSVTDLRAVPPTHRSAVKRFAQFQQSA